jgi:PAS domain S-box-containing protein
MTTDVDWYHIPKQSLSGITPTLELVKLVLDCDRVGVIYQSHGLFSFYDHLGVSHPVNKNEIGPLLISGLFNQPEAISTTKLQQTDYPCARILPLQDIDNKLYGLFVITSSTTIQNIDQPIVHHAPGILCKQLIAGLRSVSMETIDYRVILDNMPAMIAHVGSDNIFIFGNRTYQDYFHIHGEKLIGLNIEEAVDLKAHPQYQQAMDQVRRGEVAHFERSVHVMREKKTLAMTFIPGELGGDFYIFLKTSLHTSNHIKNWNTEPFTIP